jgi:predicted transcriptional regulator
MKMQTTTITLPKDLRDRLDAIASREQRSLSGQIRLFLDQAVSRNITGKPAPVQAIGGQMKAS